MAIKQVFNSSAELNYPKVLPTLDLNFANTKTLDPRITFTRASGGSYVGADGLIKYAGVNEARFDHDPENGESLGLLIEEARTNSLLRSEEFDNSYWSKNNNVSVQLTSIPSPGGTQNVYKVVENTNNSTHNIFRGGLSSLPSATYTFSVYLKISEVSRSIVFLRFDTPSGSSAQFNLITETIGNISSTLTARIQKLNNGWYRCSITTNTSVTLSNAVIELSDNASRTYEGDGASGIYIWGAQLEVGSFPTSYIPTQASTRTRARDIASITGKNFSDFYNRTESSIFVEYLMKGNFGTDGFNIVLEISDGTTQNRFSIPKLGSASSSTYEFFNINNINELNFATIPSNYGSFYKYTAAFKENDFVRYRIDNTNILRSNIDSTLPLSKFFPNQLSIGYESTTNSKQLNGYIRRLTYFPKRLLDSQLIALTS